MLGMQFTRVNEDGASFSLADLPIDPVIWDGSSIQLAFTDSKGLVAFNTYTIYADDPNWNDGPSGWYDGDSLYAGDTEFIDIVTGYWFVPTKTGEITFKGEVSKESVEVPVIGGEWQMIANPYPAKLMLEDIPMDAETWDGTSIQLASTDSKGLVTFNTYTIYVDDPNWNDGPSGWYDGDSLYAGDTVEIPVGDGFWLIPTANGTITFDSPVAD